MNEITKTNITTTTGNIHYHSKKCKKEINAFIQQVCIKLIKSYSTDFHIVTTDFYFK